MSLNKGDKEIALLTKVPPKTGIKTITSNGTYKASDESLDGYSEVNVQISSVDINEYFNTEIPVEERGSNNIKTAIGGNMIKKIPTLTISDLETQSVQNLFGGGINYQNEIDVSIKSKVITNCAGMFYNAFFTAINIENDFDTSNVVDMSKMFYGNDIKTLDLSFFNTQNVATMASMFNTCRFIESLDLSNFNTANVSDMSQMFYGCTRLKTLNISNFDFSNVENYDDMFGEIFEGTDIVVNVPADCSITVKDATAKSWITSKFTWLTNVHYIGE